MSETIVTIATYYGYAGMAVAALFILIGLDRIDPAARNAVSFRPLIVPGIVLLWPLVLYRWWALERAGPAGGQ